MDVIRSSLILICVGVFALIIYGVLRLETEKNDPSYGVHKVANDISVEMVEATLTPEATRYTLQLLLTVDNRSANTLSFQSPSVRLVTGNEHEIPAYFVVLQPLPEVPAGERKDITIKFLLSNDELKLDLWLIIGQKRLLIKKKTMGTRTWDQPHQFRSTEW